MMGPSPKKLLSTKKKRYKHFANKEKKNNMHLGKISEYKKFMHHYYYN